MLFNSHVFLFVFLPLVLAGFYALGTKGNGRPAGIWLIACSLVFYGWWNPRYLPLIVGSILFNYQFGVWIHRAVAERRIQTGKRILIAGVSANLLLLGYYKYAGFFVETVDGILGHHSQFAAILLPLAISFFTFTQIAYLTDAWRQRTREYDLLHYSLFVTFFPHLIAGPIVHYKSLMPQFARRELYRFQAANFSPGLTLLIFGLAKKVLLADNIAPAANSAFTAAAGGQMIGAAAAWIGALAYTLQLYFDFSGYSDAAVGIARMFNIRFPLNFDSPYKATNLSDFWRRWHITLSTFLRDHLYIPLGGNRKGPARRYLNLMVTMLLGGLWHGAGWTFVAWGGWHGLGLWVHQLWRGRTADASPTSSLARFLGWAATFLVVVMGWVLFRAENLQTAGAMFAAMAWRNGAGHLPGITTQTALILVLAAAIAFLAPNTQQLLQLAEPAREGNLPRPLWRLTPLAALSSAALFTLVILYLSKISDFLYFQF